MPTDYRQHALDADDEVIVSEDYIQQLIAEGAPKSLIDAIRQQNAVRESRQVARATA